MFNPISLVLFTLAAVVLFWLCYETYERKGFEMHTAVLAILPGLLVILGIWLFDSGMYLGLFAVMAGITVMCALYLILFWGRRYMRKHRQGSKK